MISEIIDQMMGGEHSIRRKAIAGGNWLLLKSIVIASLDLARAAVFARILAPDDYGLMALAMTGIGMFEAFSATGIDILIQRDGLQYRDKLPGYWTIKLTRGITLCLLTMLLAGPVSDFYAKPELVPVIRFLALSFLFRGASGFGLEIRQRDMHFRKIVLVEIAAGVTVLAAGIAILLATANVWALAAYSVMNAFAMLLVSYILYPWRPSFHPDLRLFREVICFSGSINLMNIFNYVFTSVDVAIIGRLLGTEQAGYYARSNFLALLPATYFAGAIAPILLPALNKVAGDPARLHRAFTSTLLAFVAIFSTMGLTLFLLSKFIIIAIYGSRWLPIQPVFNILLIYGVSKSIVMIVPPILYIKGRQWTLTACGGITAALLPVLCIPLTTTLGLNGTAWAVATVAATSHAALIALACRMLARDAGSPHPQTHSQCPAPGEPAISPENKITEA